MMAAATKASTRSAARSLRITSPPMFLLLQLTEGCGACVRCETCGTHDDAFRFRIKIHVICPGSFEGGAGCVESSAELSAFLFRFLPPRSMYALMTSRVAATSSSLFVSIFAPCYQPPYFRLAASNSAEVILAKSGTGGGSAALINFAYSLRCVGVRAATSSFILARISSAR